MRSGGRADEERDHQPVVERALESPTRRVNLSTGVGYPSDKAAAVGLFRVLEAGGEDYDAAEIAAWAAKQRLGARGRARAR